MSADAVDAASAAFPAWSATFLPADRIQYLFQA